MKPTVKPPTSKILKIGTNRGKPRAWVEGKFLIDAEWTRGVTYNQTIENGALVLTRAHTGKKRVAGSDGRPVLDLNGGYLVPLFEGCTAFSVTHSDTWHSMGAGEHRRFNQIVIKGVKS